MMDGARTLGDVVEAIRSMFGRLAKPHEQTKGHPHNVRIRYGQNDEEDKILVTFMMINDLMVDVKIDLGQLLEEGRPYLDRTMEKVADMIDESLEMQQRATRSVITLS